MKLSYRADIDGLRAIAVLFVILFHIDSTVFTGGFIGVDVFFVISGYLITQIIEKELAQNKFSILAFYERRFRRILPALFIVVIATSLVALVLLNAKNLMNYGRSVAATALFSSNILFLLQSGYFDTASEYKPLLHTWSLAVEEQFYIVFPLLMMLIHKFSMDRYTVWIISLAGLSFVLSLFLVQFYPSMAFYLIPSRAWELLLGCILALHVIPPIKIGFIRELVSASGFVLIISSGLLFSKETEFPGLNAVFPVLGTGMIIYSGAMAKPIINRVLSIKPLVFIGLISYSFYLWHWPVIVFGRHYYVTELTDHHRLILFCTMFILAILSWKFIEQLFRNKLFFPGQRRLLFTATTASIALLVMGLVLVNQYGLRDRFISLQVKTESAHETEWQKWELCDKKINADELCDIGDEARETSFVLWGDSHARSIVPGINLSAKRYSRKGKLISMPGCPPLKNIDRLARKWCRNHNERVLTLINQSPEIKLVFLAARWALSAKGTRYKSEPGSLVQLSDKSSSNISGKSNSELVEIGLKRIVNDLLDHGKSVVLIQQIPEVGYDVPSALYVLQLTGRDVNKVISPRKAEYMERTKEVRLAFDELLNLPKIAVVNPASLLCQSEICLVLLNNQLLYRDSNHLSIYGAHYLSKSFDDIFYNAAAL